VWYVTALEPLATLSQKPDFELCGLKLIAQQRMATDPVQAIYFPQTLGATAIAAAVSAVQLKRKLVIWVW
jgi:hypothetical protein